MVEVSLAVWGAIASLLTLMMGWLWNKIEGNDARIEQNNVRTKKNKAENGKLKARLYGESARTDDGDVNQLQERLKAVEETQAEVLSVKQDIGRVTADLYGADGDDRRNGLVNDVHELRELLYGTPESDQTDETLEPNQTDD